MIETKSDMMRRKVFSDASKDVAKNGFNIQQQTMNERLNELRARANRPKRKIPWMTIITIATCLPFLFDGTIPLPSVGGGAGQVVSTDITNAMPEVTPEMMAQGRQVLESIDGDTATISIQFGDHVVTKEVPVEDIKAAMQSQMGGGF